MTSPLKRRNQGLDTEDRIVSGKRQKTEASQEEDESDSYSHSTGSESEDGRGSDREPDEHDGTGSESEENSEEEDSESPAASPANPASSLTSPQPLVVTCFCDLPARLLTVYAPTKNQGRRFETCHYNYPQCKYWEWSDNEGIGESFQILDYRIPLESYF
ncbi:hypothetical protein K438DRAFT_883589 [Mycena galopus ATCC 62051]|nr:hypothetical protein K438DRAFT_883589 [Mycena galopus ATCC 62051]